MDFQIGDRVVGIGVRDELDIDGQVGTVVLPAHNKWDVRVAVEFDERFSIRLHSCGNKCCQGHGYYVSPSNLRLVSDGWTESDFQLLFEGE